MNPTKTVSGIVPPSGAEMALSSVDAPVPKFGKSSGATSLKTFLGGFPPTLILRLAILTLLAVAVHGYHFAVDDAAIYLPAVLKVVHPNLYPYGAEFFLAHTSLSQFALIVGDTARLSRLNDDLVIFLWHVATIFLFLLAAWQLAEALFVSDRARWSAVLMSAATLTVPVAGTALVIMDPYLTARSASTPFSMLALAAWLSGRRALAVVWIALAFLAHPLMAAYGLLCLGFLAIPARWTERPLRLIPSRSLPRVAAMIPIVFSFAPVSPAYRQAISMRSFLFLFRWAWWEWIGLAAPAAILLWLARINPRGASPAFRGTCRALALLGVFATLVGILFSSVPAMENYIWLQPMRTFHLIYVLFFLILGGALGEYLLEARVWLWVPVFSSLTLGMFFIQRNIYPNSGHIEWPWARSENSWVAAFQWVRENTPENAVFALCPGYIMRPGEDQHGFRAIARRSALSDYYKDSGVVSVFPQLAGEWQREQQAQQGWANFRLADFEQLARAYPVSWVVLQGPAPLGLDCPYKNEAVTVCRIPGATGL